MTYAKALIHAAIWAACAVVSITNKDSGVLGFALLSSVCIAMIAAD